MPDSGPPDSGPPHSAAPPEAYLALEGRFRRLGALGEASAILGWDLAVMMPAGSGPARGEQLAALAVTRHELLTDPRVADWLAAAEAASNALDDWQRANLGEMRRIHRHATALDGPLGEARAKAWLSCEATWRDARQRADFQAVLPALSEVVRLTRESAGRKAAVLGCSPYEALLDAFEPGGKEAAIAAIFERLARELPPLLAQVLERQRRRPAPLLPAGPFPIAAQEQLGRRLMGLVGFDFARGRLDVSAHPFSGGTPDDIRITTRYDRADFTRALMGVLHETGHAMYEAGLPAAWRRQPVGEARGMTLHESQSLLVEMQAARSPEFVGFLAPLAAAAFGGSGPAWSAANLTRLYHKVEPGFIRVDADEVTYPAHVILRFRLERAIIAGDLALADLPGAWNEGLRDLLGIVPPNDALGCLQDIHWYDGGFGYFPTYTLGAMTAAQLFAAAKAERPEIPAALAGGDFRPLMGWLGERVHGRASSASTDAIVAAATGRPLDPDLFLRHLRTRYLED